jgi:membrane fusion protein, multidrug efflux system
MRTITVTLVALMLAACGAKQAPQDVVRPAQLAQVVVAANAQNAVFAGAVAPRHEADVGFRIGGKIVARTVDVGAHVTKGQVVARLDPADVGLAAEAAKAQVAATETEFRFAQAEYDRYRHLFEQKFISASALDGKRNTLDANRAKYEQAQANLAVSQNQASYASLVATESGVVTWVNAEPGQVVTAGQPVVRIAREDEREVAIAVPENRIGEVKKADELLVSLWANPAKVYRGRVREVAPAVDPVTRTFAVRVSIVDADAAVQWGMTANVGVLAGGERVALVPLTAIYQRDGKPAVWRFDPASGRVSLTPIDVGQYREDGVVVKSGIANGDWIVTAGVHKLIEGQVVRPYESGPAAALNNQPPRKQRG